MKAIAFVVLAAAACSNKTSKCEDVRDKLLPQMQRNVDEAVRDVKAEQRDEIRAQGAKEIEQFKARFVQICKDTDDLDFACFDEPPRRASDKCRAVLDPMWKKVYGDKP